MSGYKADLNNKVISVARLYVCNAVLIPNEFVNDLHIYMNRMIQFACKDLHRKLSKLALKIGSRCTGILMTYSPERRFAILYTHCRSAVIDHQKNMLLVIVFSHLKQKAIFCTINLHQTYIMVRSHWVACNCMTGARVR